MRKLINEFKEFALRGNVIDLAVGVIIGAAFQNIVSSLTDDIIFPLIGLIAKTTKKCPYCLSEIAIEATRCPHCTSILDENN